MAKRKHRKTNKKNKGTTITNFGSHVVVSPGMRSSSDSETGGKFKKRRKRNHSNSHFFEEGSGSSCTSSDTSGSELSDTNCNRVATYKKRRPVEREKASFMYFNEPGTSSSKNNETAVFTPTSKRNLSYRSGRKVSPNVMNNISTLSVNGNKKSHRDANKLSEKQNESRDFASFLKTISFDSSDSESDDEFGQAYYQKELNHSEGSSRKTLEELKIGTDSEESETQLYALKKKEAELSNQLSPPLFFNEKPEDQVMVVTVPSKNIEILLLRHPAAVTLRRYVKLTVLSGGVSVMGHQLGFSSKQMKVFSSEKTGIITLTTEYSDNLLKSKDFFGGVKSYLENASSDEIAQKVLENCKLCTIIVILERCLYPPPLQFLTLYYPFAFEFSKKPKPVHSNLFDTENVSEGIAFDYEYREIAEVVQTAIRRAEINAKKGPRILVYGPKDTGKSTLIRCLINNVLNMFEEVYYLDVDPGQTEFTPPGVVSLTKVANPLLGPPFTHQKQPLKMVFTGSITAETSPPMYTKSVRELMNFFASSYSSETLFVNTMGWVEGIGAECLLSVIKCVEPTIVVELVPEGMSAVFKMKQFEDRKMKYFKITPENRPRRSPTFKAPALRNLAVLAYLGKLQKQHLRPTYLNDFQPYCVCWDKVAIYIFGKKCAPYRLVEAINSSFVALCNVDASLILESDINGYQRTLMDDPINECLGFGAVKAVDEANHLLYIVTPLSLKELKRVNAIMKGNILLPHEIYLEQPVCKVALPFTDQSTSAPALSRKAVKKRIRRSCN